MISAGRISAQDALYRSQWNLRETGAVGKMTSSTQVNAYRYDKAIALTGVQLARRMIPWLELHVGVQVGFFAASRPPAPENQGIPTDGSGSFGGLLDLTTGVLVRVPSSGVSPYATVDLGPGWSGDDFRPYVTAGVGVDLPLVGRHRIGPVAGYSDFFQWRGSIYSSDARFLWVGVSFRQQAGKRVEQAPTPQPPPTRNVMIVTNHEPPTPPASSTSDREVFELIERALPVTTQRVELLAPVLFDFDSDALQPYAVAMLHEVRQTLEAHPEIARVQIEGYADQRGSADYNRALALRRAQRVRAWLLAHGIGAERLEVVSRGATGFVEPGSDAVAREQNRRVIFRIMESNPESTR